MNLKKLCVIFILIVQFIPAYSRKNSGLYISVGAEYGSPAMGKRGFISKYNYNYLPPSAGGQRYVSRSRIEKASFGDGLWIDGNIGYYFMANLSFNLGIQVGISQNKKVVTHTLDQGGGDFQTTSNYTKYPLLLAPGFKYQYPINKKFSINANMGVVLPISVNLYTDDWFYQTDLTSSETQTRFSIGFISGVGAECCITKQLSVSAGLGATFLNVDSKTETMTSYTRDGKDVMDQIPEWQKTISYQDDIQLFPGSSQPPPTLLAPPYEIPLSRIGLKIGISYNF